MKNLVFTGTLFLLLFSACDETKISSLHLTNWSRTLIMGQTYQIEVTVYPLAAAKNATVSWSTSDATVATVSPDGTVTALTPGLVVITASSGKAFSKCEITVKAVEAAFDFKSAAFYFYGDVYGKGTNSAQLRLFEKDLSYNEKGGIGGSGFFMTINLNSSLKDSVLLNGEYKAAKTREPFTFFAGVDASPAEGSFLGEKNDQGFAALFVKEGTVTVAKSGAGHSIAVSLVGANGELLRGSYSGTVETFDLSGFGLDKKELNFSSGSVVQLGDVYSSGYNVARLRLKQPQDSLQLDFYVDRSVVAALPVGTYTVSEQAKSFAMVKGHTADGKPVGCWLLGTTTEAVEDAVVSVSKNGAEYLITYTLHTKGTEVKGRCQGALSFR